MNIVTHDKCYSKTTTGVVLQYKLELYAVESCSAILSIFAMERGL